MASQKLEFLRKLDPRRERGGRQAARWWSTGGTGGGRAGNDSGGQAADRKAPKIFAALPSASSTTGPQAGVRATVTFNVKTPTYRRPSSSRQRPKKPTRCARVATRNLAALASGKATRASSTSRASYGSTVMSRRFSPRIPQGPHLIQRRDSHMPRKVNVIGVGWFRFAKPGKSEEYHVMATKAGKGALADAKVPFDQVQQAYAGYVYGDSTVASAPFTSSVSPHSGIQRQQQLPTAARR